MIQQTRNLPTLQPGGDVEYPEVVVAPCCYCGGEHIVARFRTESCCHDCEPRFNRHILSILDGRGVVPGSNPWFYQQREPIEFHVAVDIPAD